MLEDRDSTHATAAASPSVLIVMGVSGSGKTTIAALLAGLLHCEFADADSFHPDANVRKMSAGVPLTDDDRRPWLHAIRAWVDAIRAQGRCGVIACSALKRSYRDILVADNDDVRIVYLRGDPEIVRHRLTARQGHFMPIGLLESQFETLEEPGPEEHPIVVSVDAEPRAITNEIVRQLGIQAPLR
jgi:gluconokinase